MQLSLHPNIACSRVSPAARVAARAGSAFVARARGVIEICATRPLQEIAADGRGIAKLRGRAGQQRLGNSREACARNRRSGEIGIANERADAHTTVGKIFDAVEVRNMGDVDEPFWPADASLHQVQKIGAGSKISGARSAAAVTASRIVAGRT